MLPAPLSTVEGQAKLRFTSPAIMAASTFGMVSWQIMSNSDESTNPTQRIATLLAANDTDGLRADLVALLERPGSIVGLRALDQATLLTQIIPELEPARATDQPNVHFLPVLAHSFETVCAVEWLLDELQGAEDERRTTNDQRQLTIDGKSPVPNLQSPIPIAVQTHPD